MRPFQWSDLDALAALAADPEVMRYVGDGVETREQVVQGMERAVRRWNEERMSWWAVLNRADMQLIGRCCLQRVRDLSEIEIGYAFDRRSWGHGFATEAAFAALQHAFGSLSLSSIVALTHPDNGRSKRVLARCGFMHEATIPLRGRDVDLYRLTAETWAERSDLPAEK